MKLKFKKIDDKGRDLLICESKFLFFKRERKFVAQSRLCKGFWSWLELPNLTIVPDGISFQLDAWNNEEPKLNFPITDDMGIQFFCKTKKTKQPEVTNEIEP